MRSAVLESVQGAESAGSPPRISSTMPESRSTSRNRERRRHHPRGGSTVRGRLKRFHPTRFPKRAEHGLEFEFHGERTLVKVADGGSVVDR